MTDSATQKHGCMPNYVLVIVCMSARKKAPVNLLMCTFELYMFIGVSMQLRKLSEVSSDPILLVGCTCKKKKKKKECSVTGSIITLLLIP